MMFEERNYRILTGRERNRSCLVDPLHNTIVTNRYLHTVVSASIVQEYIRLYVFEISWSIVYITHNTYA